MPEEAQDVTVTNTGQPQVVTIEPATSDETALATECATPTNVTVTIDPASD